MDASSLHALARRTAAVAGHVRSLAHEVSAATAVDWQSPAATVFRHRAVAEVTHLRRLAARLDHAAALVARHASAVESG